MPNSLSSKKRVRQNATRKALNRWRSRNYREAVAAFQETLLHGTVEQAETELKALYKLLDQTASSGVLHKNTVSRYKSRLTTRFNARKAAKAA